MRGEAHHHLAAGGFREFLVELGHVAMMADAIGVEAFGHFREQHFFLGRPARPGHAGFGVDDDLVRIDRLGLEQRDQRQFGAGRVAAGIGDEPRLLRRPRDRPRSVRRPLPSAAPARNAHGRTSAHKPPDRTSENPPRGRRPWSTAPCASRSLITFCVVPCGSAQKATIEPERFEIGVFDRGQCRQRITARIAETRPTSACRRGGRR